MTHGIPSKDQTEPTFTTVLLGIISDYVDSHSTGDAKPHITRMEDNRFLWQSGKLSMSVTINDVSREYIGSDMGKKWQTPRCSCGHPLPCPDHTGSDGDTADYYNPDIDQNDPGGEAEQHHRHERN